MKSHEEIEQALTRLMPAALRPAAYEVICSDIENRAHELSSSLPTHTPRLSPSTRVTLSVVDAPQNDHGIVDFPNAIPHVTQLSAHDCDPKVEMRDQNSAPRRRLVLASVAAAGVAFMSSFLLLQPSTTETLAGGLDRHATEPANPLDSAARNNSESSFQEASELVHHQQSSNVLIDRREQLVSDDASQLVTDEDGTVHRAYRFRRTTEEKVRDSATGLIITVTEPRDEEVRIPVNSF